ncbi:LuxR family transcriptional regulator [Lentzea sp. NBRC 105346]|uniref:AAA family ATPase n=1 Tax=Lentzea sp. NBRC 105346 TaxID=3032205 RepID=UPI0024A568CC|nr:LuxR family transcriptional regulator [Lentzea sp. NBRC 105346]GLZ34086.1 LuxR family transcriptional regulator [Lentzea sp. NBRC 105346]
MIDRLPLIGRDEELRSAVRALTSPEHRGVLLTGEPGVGKSRLAAEVLDKVGRTVARAYATVATSAIPFGALASLIPADLPAANPLRAAAEHLTKDRRLVLAVDDAHLLDEASTALLQYLVRHDLARVLCTARPAWQGLELVTIPVPALKREHADALLESVLGGPADSATRHLVWTNSQGNPLFLKELVAAGQHSGALVKRLGWCWEGPLELSGRLAEVVDHTLDRLTPERRRALEILAYGEPLELDLWSSLTSHDIVDELESQGLVRIEVSGQRARVRLGHPLYGTRLRATCPTLRARSHRRALADGLEAFGARRRGDLLRVVTWRLDSGSNASAEMLTRAAQQALTAQDWVLAERLCRQVVEQGEGNRVGLVHGLVLMYQRSCEQAEKVLAELMREAPPENLVQLASTRAFNLFFGLGRLDDAVAVLDSVTGVPPEFEDTLLYIGLTFALEYAPLPLVRAGAEMLSASTGWGAVAGQQVRAFCQLFAGEPVAALESVNDNDAGVSSWRDRFPGLRNGAEGIRADSLLRAGELDDAEKHAAQMLADVLDESRWAVTQAPPRLLSSRIARLRGQAATAVRMVAEAATESDALLMWDVLMLAELAQALALHGEAERAEGVLDRAECALRPAWRMAGFAVSQARSWVLAAAGRVGEAAEQAVATAEAARAHGAHGDEIVALHDAARFGADTSARLTELASTRTDRLTQAYSAHANARAAGDPRALEAVASEFVLCGVQLYAAEALAEASRMHRMAGRLREAEQLARQVGVLAARFDHATTPGLVVASSLASLTPRQLEIARLAVAGLTNAQIADRLTISKRTVDNHLHTIYNALGLTGRDGLRTIFGLA